VTERSRTRFAAEKAATHPTLAARVDETREDIVIDWRVAG
jgi:hypothetical protein